MIEAEPTAFPLQWPVGRPRCSSREPARFGTVNRGTGQPIRRESLSIAQGARRLTLELERFGARDVVISTNVRVNLTGMPTGNAANPADPGVAVYFRLHGQPHCLAADKFTRVADNLAAVAKHVEAVRTQIRMGAVEENQVFSNVRLLAAVGIAKTWWEILGVSKDAGMGEIERAFDKKIRETHPDKAAALGVSPESLHNRAAEINAARSEGLRAREVR